MILHLLATFKQREAPKFMPQRRDFAEFTRNLT